MAYSLELKKQVLERMKYEKIQDIAEDTGIHFTTLYKWKRDNEARLNQEKTEKVEEIKETIEKNEDLKEDELREEGVQQESIDIPEEKSEDKKSNVSISKKSKKVINIEQAISKRARKTVNELQKRYYVKMQPTEGKVTLPKEYYKLLDGIKKVNSTEKRRRMQIMQDMLKENYESNEVQREYAKRYDKLQAILASDKQNKRAQMELMLVLINEGYGDVVEEEFPEKDNNFINEIIQQYKNKTVNPKEAKKEIDEYCL